MSSSSSSDHNKKSYQYDVFLSFSGEDTRRSFVDHLFEALQHHNIRTFKDDERLQKGKEIKDELLKSIDDSRFSLIVFSKKYASSSWCLDELVKIMECQKKTTDQSTAFPVFYDVEPTEVRHQSGSVGEAFAKHTKKTIVTKNLTRTVGLALARHTSKKIGEWRKALKDAANLSGWELKNTADGHEAKVIKLIVEQISLELRSINTVVDENLIGMEPRILALDPFLEIGSDDVRMIGIKGMGGAGKTTLARAIFDKISFRFEGKSFVENVREISKAPFLDLKRLQEQVLTDVLKDKSISVSSVHEGTNLMKTMLCGKKVLIVLDDVDHINQLEALAGDPSWFKLGSRIIITTRDEQVLIAHRVRFIEDVQLLSDEEAIHLFSRHAFREAIPTQEYERQSLDQVVRYAAGLPLTIKVLGSHLCGQGKLEWADTLLRLKTIPLKETIMKLEISYDSLEDDYKEIFLDVACFCRYMEEDDAILMLESCGYHARNGLKVLQHKSLIKIDVDYEDRMIIEMHDHIEEMGKNIVRREHKDEPHKHSRLWVHEEIKHILAKNLHLESLEVLYLDGWNLKEFPNYIITGQCNNSLLELQLSQNFDIEELPLSIGNLHNLVSLNIHGYRRLEILLRSICSLQHLRTLEIVFTCITQLPYFIGQLECLKKLDLSGSHLERLPGSICKLKHLKNLILYQCELLEMLPDDVGQLESLEELNLAYCSRLRDIPSNICKLKLLKDLKLCGCRRLEKLPHDMGNLQCLQILDIRVTCITHLPPSISLLKGLKIYKFDVKDADFIQLCFSYVFKEPQIQGFQQLRTLDLGRSGIKEVPDALGHLELLERLKLSYTDVKNLPDSICMLKRLKNLILESCVLLQKLPDNIGELESLEGLYLARCYSIRESPSSICMLKQLKILCFWHCFCLEKLPEEIGQLESLEELCMTRCYNIREIPKSICLLKKLKKLELEGCRRLEKLPDDIGLVYLNLVYCKNLKSFLFIEHLESLEVLYFGMLVYLDDYPSYIITGQFNNSLLHLHLFGMTNTEEVHPSIGSFHNLVSLCFSNCQRLEIRQERIDGLMHQPKNFSNAIVSICKLKHLKTLILHQCGLPQRSHQSLDQFEYLEKLDLSGYHNFRDTPSSICELKHLKDLNLSGCMRLDKLPGDLEGLKIHRSDVKYQVSQYYDFIQLCFNRSPQIQEFQKLRILDLKRCGIEEVPEALGHLELLEYLNLSYTDVKHLPDSICMLKHLKYLSLQHCVLLEKLPDNIGELESLEGLYLSSYVYDVFLSFCGEDTRKNFVDHLYAALDQQCICTFKDDEKLQKGRDISDDLLQSIEESRFYIIVFSKRYASSSWCLNELLKIMECHKTNGHTAFPVFYDVYPSEVRKQSGLVGEALAIHNKYEPEVEKWREALTKAADLSGWDVRNTADGHEAKVIKLIVEKVSSELRPIDLNVDESLVGMEKRMKDLESCLEIGSNDVRMIGIKGMGGAGKTTLARAIFDKISFNFEDASFVENVRETTSQYGLKKLQKQVLRDVLKDSNITVKSVHEGKNLIKKKLIGKKVLIVLDDVDSEEQLEELAGDPNWFKPGSRVIITTRDEQVFNTYTVKWIIDVTLLSDEEAIRLFSRHAFRRNNPSQEYETQSREVVRYAAGLPLTIKVLGSSLRGKNKTEWKDTISRLKTIPLNETLKKLELSYESLEDDYKEMFLDVACFLRHWHKDTAIEVLESCGFHAINGLRVLEQKSLIKIVKISQGYEKIRMHDHIVEMGQNIVRREHPNEPSKHSRLWVKKEIKGVLANDLGTEATRCIYLDFSTDGIVLESLQKMKKLRCFIIGMYRVFKKSSDNHVKIDEAPQYFPNSLQYLSWNGYPHRCLPKTFEANNLVTLHMTRSKIEQLWNEGRVMKKLKFLFLGFSKLKSLDLGMMPNLERLDLHGCSDLVKLDVHGGCLKSLVYLNLSRCYGWNMKEFPNSSLKHLKTLILRNCLLLEKLSDDADQLKSLEKLDLTDCYNLRYIPSSICKLKHLKYLNLNGCRRLDKLPDDMGDLQCLQLLDIEETGITHLPPNISMLKGLKICKTEGEGLAVMGLLTMLVDVADGGSGGGWRRDEHRGGEGTGGDGRVGTATTYDLHTTIGLLLITDNTNLGKIDWLGYGL
ncbi:hypothetical protein R6Q59_002282 [Mikania micrantha]